MLTQPTLVRRGVGKRGALLAILACSGLAGSPVPLATAAEPGTIAFQRNTVTKLKNGKFREVRRVWTMRGDGTHERPFPGRLSGFARWIGGGRRLAVEYPDGSIITTSRRGRDRRFIRLGLRLDGSNRSGLPAWAPNGRSFAFDYFARSVDTTKIYVSPAASASERELPLGETELLTNPDWSPDGKTIAAIGKLPTVVRQPDGQYTTRPRTVGVWLLNPAGGDPRRLATWPQLDSLPGDLAWSPNGKEIAVPHYADNPAAGREDYPQLLLINARTGQLRRLPREPKPGAVTYGTVTWSPDGRYIAYTQSGSGLWVVNPRTGRRKRLARAVYAGLTWAPNSRVIAFPCYSGCGPRPRGIWTVSLNGKFKRLTRGYDSLADLAWAAR